MTSAAHQEDDQEFLEESRELQEVDAFLQSNDRTFWTVAVVTLVVLGGVIAAGQVYDHLAAVHQVTQVSHPSLGHLVPLQPVTQQQFGLHNGMWGWHAIKPHQ